LRPLNRRACLKTACHLGKGEAESSIRIACAGDEHDIGYTRSGVDAAVMHGEGVRRSAAIGRRQSPCRSEGKSPCVLDNETGSQRPPVDIS
jgi:hypothetical protein